MYLIEDMQKFKENEGECILTPDDCGHCIFAKLCIDDNFNKKAILYMASYILKHKEEIYKNIEKHLDRCEFCGQPIFHYDEIYTEDSKKYHKECYINANWEEI